MGYFTDAYNQVIANFDKEFGKQRQLLEGSAAGAERSGAADIGVSASRGGYINSPLYQVLLSKNRTGILKQKQDALNQLSTAQTQARLGLETARIQGGAQDAAANAALWGNLLTGAGSLLGTGLKIFGGPPGVAAGTAVDAATKAASGVITN